MRELKRTSIMVLVVGLPLILFRYLGSGGSFDASFAFILLGFLLGNGLAHAPCGYRAVKLAAVLWFTIWTPPFLIAAVNYLLGRGEWAVDYWREVLPWAVWLGLAIGFSVCTFRRLVLMALKDAGSRAEGEQTSGRSPRV